MLPEGRDGVMGLISPKLLGGAREEPGSQGKNKTKELGKEYEVVVGLKKDIFFPGLGQAEHLCY